MTASIETNPILRFLWAMAEKRSGLDALAIWNTLTEDQQRDANTIVIGISRAALRGYRPMRFGFDPGTPGGDFTARARTDHAGDPIDDVTHRHLISDEAEG